MIGLYMSVHQMPNATPFSWVGVGLSQMKRAFPAHQRRSARSDTLGLVWLI